MKSMYKICLLFLLCCFFSVTNGQVAPSREQIKGSWLGKIAVGSVELRLVINLSVTEGDTIRATMDSPDQGAKGIPMGKVSLKGDSLIVDAPALRGNYRGLFTSDSTLIGTWSQSGNSIALNLSRLPGGFTLNRPQEPKKPFPYISEDITFENKSDGIKLAGTLTLPKGEGPFPAAILISGSGPQNRNEELMGHKPFLLLADYLTRIGYAVLRYDDRGVGSSGGQFAGNSSIDFARDASAAFSYLLTRGEIDSSGIGLIGHSEGGLIAPMVASSNDNVAFIISLAGPGVKGDQILYSQQALIMRLSGVDEEIIKANRKMNGRFYSVLLKEVDNKAAEAQIEKIYSKELKKNKVTGAEKEAAIKSLKASFTGLGYDWLRLFLKTDPAIYWKNVTCPVLALNGSKDTQVIAEENLNAIKKSLTENGNTNIEAFNFEGLNHLFQKCETGLPREYGAIEETINPVVLETISVWLNKNFK